MDKKIDLYFSETLGLSLHEFICLREIYVSETVKVLGSFIIENYNISVSFSQQWNQDSTTYININSTCFALKTSSIQFSSVQSLSRVRLFATPWIAAHQASLFITNSRSSLKLTSIELVMPSSHLILCHPLFLLPK